MGMGQPERVVILRGRVHDALENNCYADRVEEYCFGEMVPYASPAYQSLIKQRPGLKHFLRHLRLLMQE